MQLETGQIEHFRRPITLQERRFLMGAVSHISLVARFNGQISEQELRRAVDKTLETYPLFATRIDSYSDPKWAITKGAAEVPVKVYERSSDEYWLDVLNLEHAIPIRPTKGPLTRFILVQGLETSELIIFCHHSISDGRSLELALREVLLHLGDPNREPPQMSEVPVHLPEIFPDGISQSRIKRWLIGIVNKKWDKEKILFDEEDVTNIEEVFWKNSRYCVESVMLSEEETTQLINVCRENEVTVNSALVVALLKARIEALGPYNGKVKVGTAVDTRERLKARVGDAVGLYAGGSLFTFDYDAKQSFWENVKSYHKQVRKQMENNKIFSSILDQYLIDPTLFEALWFKVVSPLVEPHQSRYEKLSTYAKQETGLVSKYVSKMENSAPNVMTTNLGRLSIPSEVNGIKIERVFFTPSSGLKLEIAAGVATAAGRLTLTLNYHNGYFDEDRMKLLCIQTEEVLKGIIS
ncbi:MAG: hypothetical protein JW779_01735 [Candidatus Thorarchaeota archaeon]|nr:hypothetical protein [Candidatus Thorarchaeota archaeon]